MVMGYTWEHSEPARTAGNVHADQDDLWLGQPVHSQSVFLRGPEMGGRLGQRASLQHLSAPKLFFHAASPWGSLPRRPNSHCSPPSPCGGAAGPPPARPGVSA